MKKLYFYLQLGCFIAFNFFLLLTINQFFGSFQFNYTKPKYNYREEFDPSLQRLSSINTLSTYCDSLYAELSSVNHSVEYEEAYPDLVSSVILKRFYHGYSSYDMTNNYVGSWIAQAGLKGLNAIVVPDDILKHPYAACSQQSIVFMELLGRKGFITRKVGFKGKASGHFCFEVFYNGTWHFIDPDMEPDDTVLNAYNHPSIGFLAQHKDILLQAYHQYPEEQVLDIFLNYSYGDPNTFSAPNAIVYQQVTKFFSYTMWVFFLVAFILTRKKYLRLSRQYVRNNRIHLPQVSTGTSQVLYPNYSA